MGLNEIRREEKMRCQILHPLSFGAYFTVLRELEIDRVLVMRDYSAWEGEGRVTNIIRTGTVEIPAEMFEALHANCRKLKQIREEIGSLQRTKRELEREQGIMVNGLREFEKKEAVNINWD